MNEAVEIPGPWQHRYVAANGARFHVVECPAEGASRGDPPVLFLHGFPQFWWCWRHQLPVVAATGRRAIAMDLRGYGGSDKTPDGYDPATLAADVAGVVKALGVQQTVVVGHGWGGYVGWATAALHPPEVGALCAVAAPHPLDMLSLTRSPASALVWRHVLAMQVPMLPERRLSRAGSGTLRAHLSAWSAPGTGFPTEEEVARYQDALRLWPAPHCALEYHRWLVRSRFRADGRRFSRVMRRRLTQPVCAVVGDRDPAISVRPQGRRRVGGASARAVVTGAGHFPAEERPETFNDVLLGWLDTLRRSRLC